MPSDQVIEAGNEALVRLMGKGKSFESEFQDARKAYLKGRVLAKRLKAQPLGEGHRKRLLELGCYNGFFSLGFKDHVKGADWEVHGLEISPSLAKFVEQKLGIPCFAGTLESSEVPSNHYDYIVCHDLIEHINQPLKFLKEVYRILKPGGQIQIITPNGRQDLAYTRRAVRAGVKVSMLLNHILFFEPLTLQKALKSQGFTVKRLYGYDVRHVLKDFGVFAKFGHGAPDRTVRETPSIADSVRIERESFDQFWTPEKIQDLRQHPKTSARYALLREQIPNFLRLKIPARLAIGHEIFALAEKPQ